jgi:hypothetical protein
LACPCLLWPGRPVRMNNQLLAWIDYSPLGI